MKHEVYVLLGMLLCGASLSVLFDLRRGIWKPIKPADFIVIVTDLLFWAICAAAVSWTIWKLNSGILRIYEFVGLFLGALIYFLTLSAFVVRGTAFVTENILKIMKNILKILLTPLIFLYKIIYSIRTKQLNKKARKKHNERNERIRG